MTASGEPFFVHGDTAWSIAVQLTPAQITSYLDDRQAKGFTAILFNAVEHLYSSQSPAWRNAAQQLPFAPYNNFAARVEAYWQVVDHVVAQANQRSMICIINPAYLGFGGGASGWTAELIAETTSDLQNYGAWLANRYAAAGVIWCLGGDYDGAQHPGLLAKQWNIVTGIRSVNPNAIVTAHGKRTQSAYSVWSGFVGLGFNLNTIYTDGSEHGYAETEYARPGPTPFFLIEGFYDGETGGSLASCRRQAYVSVLSGACGHMFGNNPIWGFGEPNSNGGAGAASALSTSLSTPATMQMAHVKTLFTTFSWWKLQPRVDASLVTSGLGVGTNRICPALASDGSFAMIWSTGGAFTVDMSALAPSAVQARWYNTSNGTFSAVSGSPFVNSGTVEFTPSGERVLVLQSV